MVEQLPDGQSVLLAKILAGGEQQHAAPLGLQQCSLLACSRLLRRACSCGICHHAAALATTMAGSC